MIVKIARMNGTNGYNTIKTGVIDITVWLEDGCLRHWTTNKLTIEQVRKLEGKWIDTETLEILSDRDFKM